MKNLTQSLKNITVASIFFIGLLYVSAWVGPTQTAPSGNVPAPINVGSLLQSKLGSLNILGDLAVGSVSNPINSLTIHGKGYSESTEDTDTGHTLVTKDYIDGRLLPPICSSFTYTSWSPSVCSNGTQTRTITTSSPAGCTGGTPITSQVCTIPTCTSFTYTSWSPSVCSNGTQTRTVTTSSPSGCTGGTPVTNQSCTVPRFTYTRTISNVANYDLRSAMIADGWDGVMEVDATITTTGYIYSTSASVPAFSLGGSFPAGSNISIINNGYIVGKGGDGGQGGYNCNPCGGSVGAAGGSGGPALSISAPVSITNNGVIGGGGGGGGGAGSGGGGKYTYYTAGQGGSGGAGYYAGAAGPVGVGSGGGDGNAGTLEIGGAAVAAYSRGVLVYAGGGGNLGQDGTYGTASIINVYPGTTGPGAAGVAVIKNGNTVTWVIYGDVRGSVY